ncbi:MAG: hypothetical protein A3C53_05910 [Omnitrophica WOR_2 bacterium RIFCSPHIGHO2_02_FULL_68_15]|nr:MAG: hypothetical protein A3C53_05910 [Omnitrophica WOR_2 bacterium RIFCSPHIGHO2_02_FULL_68_15]
MRARSRPFQVVRRRLLFRGRVVRATVIRHPKSVVLLPLLPGRRVVLIRQFRAAIERFIHEIPAGTTEPGEGVLACCRRELAEETGYRASRYTFIGRFFPAPGVSTEEMFLYRAEGLTVLAHPPAKDADEWITPRIVTAAEALRMVRDGRIRDAKTMLGITFGLGRVRW